MQVANAGETIRQESWEKVPALPTCPCGADRAQAALLSQIAIVFCIRHPEKLGTAALTRRGGAVLSFHVSWTRIDLLPFLPGFF